MGFSMAWLAVRGRSAAEIQALLFLAPTGRMEEVPESAFDAATLEGGWYLVVADHADAVAGPELLKELSLGGDAIAATVEEHVMFSSAEAWKDGRQVWSVFHASEKGIRHLEESGSFPDVYAGIKADLLKEQETADDCDYVFDIPLKLALHLTGFKHDESGDVEYEILEKRPKPKSGGWRGLFGRR